IFVGRHLATYVNGTTIFAHADWLGTERVRTDASGNFWNSCTSNPYGDNQACSGNADPSPIHYAGMELDSETGNYHTLFRYYNPRLGVWLTTDPAGMGAADLTDPQSLNRDAYSDNDPINFFDPFGLDPGCSDKTKGSGGLHGCGDGWNGPCNSTFFLPG